MSDVKIVAEAPQKSLKEQLDSLSQQEAAKLLEDHPVLRAARNSYADARVTDGIKTYKENSFDKDYQERYNKEHPPESEEAKALREIQQRLDAAEKRVQRESARGTALKWLTDKGLPTDLVEHFIGESDAETIAALQLYKTVTKARDQARANEVAKGYGRTVDGAQQQPEGEVDIFNMTPEQQANLRETAPEKLDRAIANARRTGTYAGEKVTKLKI